MLVAALQLSSQDDISENLKRARARISDAAKAGAKLVVLPENFAFMGREETKFQIAEVLPTEPDRAPEGPIASLLCEEAARHGIYVVGGGMPERSDDPKRPYNASVLAGPTGKIESVYRKIHLFDVSLADGSSYLESGGTKAGELPKTADICGIRLGMTVCYDLRFPELFRRLVDGGARIVTVPAAFTLATGKDHWHVLLRARAIENQVFVIAAAQHGKHPMGRQTYGKSLLIDPWGDVIAQASEGEGMALGWFDIGYQDKVRASLPCLAHRRLQTP